MRVDRCYFLSRRRKSKRQHGFNTWWDNSKACTRRGTYKWAVGLDKALQMKIPSEFLYSKLTQVSRVIIKQETTNLKKIRSAKSSAKPESPWGLGGGCGAFEEAILSKQDQSCMADLSQ
jgi:hypothetical protein